jgi:hypothetical protein
MANNSTGAPVITVPKAVRCHVFEAYSGVDRMGRVFVCQLCGHAHATMQDVHTTVCREFEMRAPTTDRRKHRAPVT